MSLKTTKGNKPFSSIFHECRLKKQEETRHFDRFFMSFDQKCKRKRVIFSTNQRFSIIFPSFCGPPSSRSLYEPLQKGGIAKQTHKLITFASIYGMLLSTSSTFFMFIFAVFLMVLMVMLMIMILMLIMIMMVII